MIPPVTAPARRAPRQRLAIVVAYAFAADLIGGGVGTAIVITALHAIGALH
jgi:hypothetical protein